MPEPHPEPLRAHELGEANAEAVRSEAIRAVRIIRDRSKPADGGEAVKTDPRVQLESMSPGIHVQKTETDPF